MGLQPPYLDGENTPRPLGAGGIRLKFGDFPRGLLREILASALKGGDGAGLKFSDPRFRLLKTLAFLAILRHG